MAHLRTLLRTLLAVLFNRPLPVRLRNDEGAHFYPAAGVVLPAISGADDDGDGDGDGEDGDGEDGDGEDGEEGDGDDDGDGEDGDEGTGKSAEAYRRELRRYEKSSKKREKRLKRELDSANKKVAKREEADKSEREKELEKAREEGRTEALTEAQKERRSDRLDAAATRLASKGLKVGEGDDAKTLRFADPEDAVVHVERAIKRGDLDEDEIFDEDHRVNKDALSEALTDLLESKPHLGAESSKTTKTAEGGADQGTGDDGGDDGDDSVEDHLKKIRRNKQ